MPQQPSYWQVMTRRKFLSTEGVEGETKLNRVLGLWDLTALGVGSTLGAGVYVLAGQIAKNQAGPSVIISFAIAALASLLAGVCYAEFGARVPKAGSAYVYSYVCIGEFAAFVIGWNLILEYIIGTAGVCRGISLYLDTLINDTLKVTFAEVAPLNVPFLGSYFDFFAFFLVVVFGVALAFGVETSAMANNFCTCLNICILTFVIVAGSLKADFANWSLDVTNVTVANLTGGDPPNFGSGGFFPYGFEGTLRGAATCFFGFVGFDCIATTGEEVRNPRRNIPRSILLSLFIIFLCYFGVSTVLTLMVPYYRQDENAPLPYAFKEVGWTLPMWIVSVGGLIGLLASLFGALFPLPRVMYSMAEDGLLFRFLGKVSVRYRVPVIGSIFAAMLTALIAGAFDLEQLVHLLSIGTLLAYSVVAISVTILRYMDHSDDSDRQNGNVPPSESTMLTSSGTRITCSAVLWQFFNCKGVRTPNVISTRIVGSLITVFCICCVAVGFLLMEYHDALINNRQWILIALPVIVVFTFIILLIICLQPREANSRIFRVPFVPVVPALSIFINIYLMLQLNVMTWIRFGIWMAVGIPVYVACRWCGSRDAMGRNRRRLEFYRALDRSVDGDKQASDSEDVEDPRGVSSISSQVEQMRNGGKKLQKIKSSTVPTVANGGHHKAAASAAAANASSIRSFDEIMRMSEVGNDLIIMRNANGKVFYIEDSRSNASATSASDDRKGSNTTAEENSVIAYLDDVLKAEENDQVASEVAFGGYSRKISIDSEMMPSVIETTTVATVHGSSDSSVKDLSDLTEVENETYSMWDLTVMNDPNNDDDEYLIRHQVAKSFVDELLNGDELWKRLNYRIMENEEENIETETVTTVLGSTSSSTGQLVDDGDDDADVDENEDVRRPSVESKKSTGSIVAIADPIRSEQFKMALSKFLMRPPQAPRRLIKSSAGPTAAAGDNDANTDLRQSNERSPSRRAIELQEEFERHLAAAKPSLIVRDDNGIPNPPKFDPVLYNTISAATMHRKRPSLRSNMHTNPAEPPSAPSKPNVTVKTLKDLEESPAAGVTDKPDGLFKTRLNALLKRGPTHQILRNSDESLKSLSGSDNGGQLELKSNGRQSVRALANGTAQM